MPKFLFCLLLSFFYFSLAADTHFSKLGSYNDVTIWDITHKGIMISHEYGVVYITEKDLSPAEISKLQRELNIYHQKAKKYEAKQIILKQQLEKILYDFAKKLPDMSQSQIEGWCQKNVGTSLFDSKFEEFFIKKFKFLEPVSNIAAANAGKKTASSANSNLTKANSSNAENSVCKKMIKKIFQRLTEIHNAQVAKLQDKILTINSSQQIKKFLQKNLGKDAPKNLRIRYKYANNHDDFISSVNKHYNNVKKRELEAQRQELEAQRQEEKERIQRYAQMAKDDYKHIINSFGYYARNTPSAINESVLRDLISLGKKASFVLNNAKLSNIQRSFLLTLVRSGNAARAYFEHKPMNQSGYIRQSVDRALRMGLAMEAGQAAADNFYNAINLYNQL